MCLIPKWDGANVALLGKGAVFGLPLFPNGINPDAFFQAAPNRIAPVPEMGWDLSWPYRARLGAIPPWGHNGGPSSRRLNFSQEIEPRARLYVVPTSALGGPPNPAPKTPASMRLPPLARASPPLPIPAQGRACPWNQPEGLPPLGTRHREASCHPDTPDQPSVGWMLPTPFQNGDDHGTMALWLCVSP